MHQRQMYSQFIRLHTWLKNNIKLMIRHVAKQNPNDEDKSRSYEHNNIILITMPNLYYHNAHRYK